MSHTDSYYTLHAELCKAIASPKRLAILDALGEREMTVGEIGVMTGLAQGNLSQHLALMRARGILLVRRDGMKVYYRVADPKIIEACGKIGEVLREQMASRNRMLDSMFEVELGINPGR